MAWRLAIVQAALRLRARLRRHPFPVQAHFRECLTLTYAVPPDILRPLLSPGLELEMAGGHGFIAVALVQTQALRPAGMPAAVGQDFFLAGYRIFTTFRTPGGRRLRGLRILRSDANRARMVSGGNLLTHYNYHRCAARVGRAGDRIRIAVSTADHAGDVRVTADLSKPALPAGSPFASVGEARRFAGPLPFTFDFEAETGAIIAIQATRTAWRPAPVSVEVEHLAFFNQPAFAGCAPVLAAAFHISNIDYRWERGVRYPIATPCGSRSFRLQSEGSLAQEVHS